MLYKSKAVVLHKIDYSDTSIIVHLYTEKFGRQSFLVKGAKRKNSKIKSSFFQPLFLIEIEAYHKTKSNLQTLKEVKIEPILYSISTDVFKGSITIFIAEILYHSLKEETASTEIFNYIFNSIQVLELQENYIGNFHIHFLITLTKYLGFYPNNNFKDNYFDMIDGSYKNYIPSHNHYLNKEFSEILNKFTTRSLKENIILKNETKILFLEKIIEYYKIHIDGFGDVRSLHIFNSLFHS